MEQEGVMDNIKMKPIDKIQERLSLYCESDGNIGDLGDLLYELDGEVEKLKEDSNVLDWLQNAWFDISTTHRGRELEYYIDGEKHNIKNDNQGKIRDLIKKAMEAK